MRRALATLAVGLALGAVRAGAQAAAAQPATAPPPQDVGDAYEPVLKREPGDVFEPESEMARERVIQYALGAGAIALVAVLARRRRARGGG